MKRKPAFIHSFVTSAPRVLEPDHLYVSLEYNSALHLCACGCGRKVVTPLSPRDWQVSYNGQTVSLHPSIGSWQLPCRSHYFIKNNKIQWAEEWSERRVQSARKQDLMAKRPDLETKRQTVKRSEASPTELRQQEKPLKSFWHWLTGR